MSRSGYIEDDGDDPLMMGRWRGMVASALRGKRGQAFLRDLAANLDAMPEKALIAQQLRVDGEFCTLGVIGAARGIDLDRLDPEDYDGVAAAFGIAPCMAQEIVFENDEAFDEYEWVDVEICGPMLPYPPEWGGHKRSVRVMVPNAATKRWQHMRTWVASQIKR